MNLGKLATAYLDELGYLADIKSGTISGDQAAALVQRAERAAREVETRFKAMNDTGELKDFNAQYKSYRTLATAQRKPIMVYRDFAEAKRMDMARSLAAEIKRRRASGMA
jgi:hypothetical protein